MHDVARECIDSATGLVCRGVSTAALAATLALSHDWKFCQNFPSPQCEVHKRLST